MKMKWVILLITSLLLSPVIITLGIEKSILGNENFWYAYLSYFGTVSLAGVSFWQNKKLNDTNIKNTQIQYGATKGLLFPVYFDPHTETTHRGQTIETYKKNNKTFLSIDLVNNGNDSIFGLEYIDGNISNINLLLEHRVRSFVEQQHSIHCCFSTDFLMEPTQEYTICLKFKCKNSLSFEYIQNLQFNITSPDKLTTSDDDHLIIPSIILINEFDMEIEAI